MISIIRGRLCTYHPDTGKRPCARLMTEFLEDTMRHTRRTWKYLLLTSGQKWGRTSIDTKVTASDVNNRKNPPTNRHLWHHFPFQNVQISGFMLTSLAQWSQGTVTKNLSFASPMPLPSTLWSLPLPTRMLKRWPTPFTEIGTQNSEFRPRSTLTAQGVRQ